VYAGSWDAASLDDEDGAALHAISETAKAA
jgi:hypothetical protein